MTDIQMIMKMRDDMLKLERENTELTLKNCDLTGRVGILRNRLTRYVTVLDRLDSFFESETNRLHERSKVEFHSTDTIKELMVYERIYEALHNIWEDVNNEYK